MDSCSSSTAALVVPSTSGPPEEEDNIGETSVLELTHDLILEIFARLPVESLLRFKCISKFWYSLICSPNFISMHSTHSRTVTLSSPGISSTTTALSFQFGENLEEKEPMLSNMEVIEDVEMMGCFNGVVCLSLSKNPQMYALWNPATTQVRLIDGAPMDAPNPVGNIIHRFDIGFVWYGSVFCYDLVTNGFKVAQVKLTFPEAAAREIRAQVNVFSTATNSWKSKNIVVPYRIRAVGTATYVNGYIHWHIDWTYHDAFILSYNMSDEVFERIEMPSRHALVHYRLAAYKGSLALFAHSHTRSMFSFISDEDEIDVWELNDCGCGNQQWSKILTCKASIKVTRVVGFFRKDGLDFILLYNNANSSYYSYDPGNGETKKFETSKSIFSDLSIL